MNQKQRDFLSNTITSHLKRRRTELVEQKVKKPSLSNYLVAAILDGSIEYQDREHLAAEMKKLVMLLGAGESIISDSQSYSSTVYSKVTQTNAIRIPADLLFVLPDGYVEACRIVDEYNGKIDAAIAAIDAHRAKLEMKIQIGSPEALEHLVEEADSLVDISLMGSIIGILPDGTQLKSLGLLMRAKDE